MSDAPTTADEVKAKASSLIAEAATSAFEFLAEGKADLGATTLGSAVSGFLDKSGKIREVRELLQKYPAFTDAIGLAIGSVLTASDFKLPGGKFLPATLQKGANLVIKNYLRRLIMGTARTVAGGPVAARAAMEATGEPMAFLLTEGAVSTAHTLDCYIVLRKPPEEQQKIPLMRVKRIWEQLHERGSGSAMGDPAPIPDEHFSHSGFVRTAPAPGEASDPRTLFLCSACGQSLAACYRAHLEEQALAERLANRTGDERFMEDVIRPWCEGQERLASNDTASEKRRRLLWVQAVRSFVEAKQASEAGEHQLMLLSNRCRDARDFDKLFRQYKGDLEKLLVDLQCRAEGKKIQEELDEDLKYAQKIAGNGLVAYRDAEGAIAWKKAERQGPSRFERFKAWLSEDVTK